MSDTTVPRDTKKYQSQEVISCPQKGSTKILKGTMVMAQAGFARPGTAATGLVALGRAKKTTDNTAGADGAMTAEAEPGIFRWANGDSIAAADRWKAAYVGDNQTMHKDGAGKSFGGIIVDVDSEGVWVATFPHMTEALVSGAGIPVMQAVNATLASGTITINSGITVAANSEVIPVLIGAITGSTSFASVGELKASRVNGAPGTGTVVIQAYGANGALDNDAAGAIRVTILTPQ